MGSSDNARVAVSHDMWAEIASTHTTLLTTLQQKFSRVGTSSWNDVR
ncbi:MAG: hypothetical protein HY049_04695 [Acidobacteria bacterium]|nr:hypothetical protein [Acidobacteriota bacterium]